MNTRFKLFVLSAVILTAAVFVVLPTNSVNAAQNPNYPSPYQCGGADWNIGKPDGAAVCSSSVTTNGHGRAMEGDPKATSIFGAESRVKPDLASLNQFCKQYTGESNSYATYGRMHNYCNFCDQNISWWNGSSWVTNTACAGTLNVQEVTCAKGCTPATPSCASHARQACAEDGVYWYNSCGQRQEKITTCGASQICQNVQCVQACPDGYTNVAQGKPASATRTEVSACNNNPSVCGPAGLAVDGNSVSWWATGSSSPASLSIDLQSEFDVNKYIIQCGGISNGNSGTVHFYNASGAEVATRNYVCVGGNGTNAAITQSSSDVFGSNVRIKSIRVDAQTNGATGDWINVNELKICGKIPCTPHASKKCVGNSVYWFDSCNNQQELFAQCTANQTCQNGQCVNIACSSNSDCGSNGYTGNPFCQSGNVYQNYITYTCSNPGTASSSCTSSTNAQLKQACASGQACSNGSCAAVVCSSNSQCGSNGYTGSPFCQGNDVYQNYVTYTCNNAGTASSYCSNSTNAQKKNNCTANQTCQNGSCQNQNIACSTNAQCGTNSLTGNPFCQGNNVYRNQLTYYCNNPGTTQSFCSNSLVPQLTKACGTNQNCVNGDCVAPSIACGSNADCGSNGLTGNAFCQNGNAYRNYITYSCNNAGTSQAFCSNSLTPQLVQTCSSNQQCVNGSCTNLPVACSGNSQCGTNGYTGSPFCQGNAVYQNYITYTCNNAGTANSYCSNSTAAQKKNDCTANQTCTNGSCNNQVINCSTNAQCGTNSFTGSPFCQSNSIYQNYITYTCNNPGTSTSYCSDSTTAQKKTSCSATNQVCQNGSCVNQTIACSANTDCGTNAYTGNPFCQGNAVYQNYITYACSNPGTATSYCSSNTVAQKKNDCTANQTCSNGSCNNQTINCNNDAECGTNSFTGNPFCQNGDVYQNFITHSCNNPGTSTSYCSESTTPQLKSNCTANQVCQNGSCVNQTIACSANTDCGTNAYTGNPFCQGNSVYQNYITYTCNNAGTSSSYCSNSTAAQKKNDCTGNQVCQNGSCAEQTIVCTSNTDCGTNAYTGSPFCQGNSVYKNYITYTCNNPGTATSYCSSSTASQQQSTCNSSQTCQNGVCITNQSDLVVSCHATPNPANTNQSVTFISNVSGGTGNYTYSWTGACSGSSSTCADSFSGSGVKTATINVTSGGQSNSATCSANINQNCSYHSYQRCSGNYLYWYDSCGNQQDSQYCPNGCTNNSCQQGNASLYVTKTVRNLTSGSGFSNSTYASPLDTVMFMITLQASGNQDVQNVFVRDSFPANLIYNNQLVIACTGTNNNYNNCNNSNYNYSGNITSGINLNTIYAGQTVTITYQAQLASAQNFAYGTTTLNNNVSVTSSNTGYTPSSNASVIVTRTAVYGASSISTGLTNNFWVDSFFLPLLVVLIGIWLWKSGMFFWVEKWFDNQKKKGRNYKSDKELAAKIAQIQKLERA